MKTALIAGIAISILASAALAAPTSATEPLRLTDSQMDTATAGAAGIHVISAAIGSRFSHSTGVSRMEGSHRSLGSGQGNVCCGRGSIIKILIKNNGLSIGETFNFSSNQSSKLTPNLRMLMPSSGGVSGKIDKLF